MTTTQVEPRTASHERAAVRDHPSGSSVTSVLLLGTVTDGVGEEVASRLTATGRSEGTAPVRVHTLVGDSELAGPGREGNPIPEATRAWIRAGNLLEKAVALSAEGVDFQLVVCLDPWAAFTLPKMRDLWPKAEWVYLSDLAVRKEGEEGDYWKTTETWMKELPFNAIVSQEEFLSKKPGSAPTISIPAPSPSRKAAGRLGDLARFRTVLADPEEPIVLAYLPKGGDCSLGDVAALAGSLEAEEGRPRWIILSDQEPPKRLPASLTLLDRSTFPFLPDFAEVADLVVLGGPAELAGVEGKTVLKSKRAGPLVSQPGRREAEFDGRAIDTLLSAVRSHLPRAPKNDSPSRSGNLRATETREFVLFNRWGIGDELLLSAVAREVKRAWPDANLWIPSRFGFQFPDYVRTDEPPPKAMRVETIYQNATLYGPAAHAPFPGHLVQQMLDKFYLDTGLFVEAKDVRPELRLPSRGERPRTRSVVLHSRPNPRLPSKDWGLDRWRALAKLLDSAGVGLIQVGGPDEPLLPYAEDRRGSLPGEVPAIMAGVGATVSLVGFLMHVAEATRTPAVVIYGGREHPLIDGYADQVHLSSGPLACRGRWGCHLGPEVECPNGMRCMEELTPELVAREILRFLDSAGGRGKK